MPSGSDLSTPAIFTFSAPRLISSPTFSFSRSSSVGSTTAPSRSASCNGPAAFDLHRADQRIRRIDRLQLGQRLIRAIRTPRHGAHGGRLADAPEVVDDGALIPLGAHMRARQRGIAAEDGLALALEAGAQRIRHRADAGDDHDAERHAGDENAKAR